MGNELNSGKLEVSLEDCRAAATAKSTKENEWEEPERHDWTKSLKMARSHPVWKRIGLVQRASGDEVCFSAYNCESERARSFSGETSTSRMTPSSSATRFINLIPSCAPLGSGTS
jgi:hypothetical protein